MNLPRTTPTAKDFDAWYAQKDPWGIRGSLPEKRQRAVLKGLRGTWSRQRVLDVGCGEGSLTNYVFAGDARTVTGIDLSEVAIERAKLDAPKNTRFLAADIGTYRSWGEFDCIVMLECLYYLPSDIQRQVLSEIKASNPTQRRTFIISAPMVGETEHRRYYTEPELIELLENSGFHIVEQHTITLRGDGSRFSQLATRVLNRLYRRVGGPVCDFVFDLVPQGWVSQKLFVCKF